MSFRSKNIFKQFVLCFIVSLPILIAGTTLGWSSPMMEYKVNGESPVLMTSEEESWMVTYIDIGNVILSLPSGIMMDRLGRKFTLFLSIPLVLAGWTFILIAQQPWHLYTARFLHGSAMGVAFIVSPSYVGEIASTSIRGTLSLVIELTYAIGMLLSYVVGWMCDYYTLATVGAVIPVLTGLLMMFVPESPYYLMTVGKSRAAAESLRALRNYDDDEFEQELEIITRSMTEEKNRGRIKDLLTRDRTPLVIVLTLSVLQMTSGLSVVQAYASSVLVDTRLQPNASAVVFGTFILVAIVPFAVTVDKYGRRPLYLVSCAGTAACHLLAAVFMRYAATSDLAGWSLLLATCSAQFFINIGLMPLLSVIQCEYFPADTRGLANSAVVFTVTFTSIVMLKAYQPVADAYDKSVNFVGYAAVTFLGTVFCYFWVPETNGKNFQQIQRDFETFKWISDERRDLLHLGTRCQ